MDKKQYFSKSSELNLPSRCPILGKCKRRAWTIYLFSEYSDDNKRGKDPIEFLVEIGEFTKAILDNPVELSGESPIVIKGNSNWHCSGVCPEVNLFDNSNSIGGFKGQAATSASYDKYFRDEKWIINEYGHYSECAEFSNYSYNQQLLNSDKVTVPKTSITSSDINQAKKSAIKKLIGKSEIERTIEELDKQLHKSCGKRDDLILLEGKYSKWRRDHNQGIADNGNVEIDRIRKALLDFCNDLEANDWISD